MTTIAQARLGLATAIQVGTGLRTEPLTLDSVNAPCAQVFRAEMDPRMVFSGSKAQFNFRVRVFMGRASEIAAQEAIDDLCELSGATSLAAAVADGDNWTDGLVDYAQVVRIGETGVANIGGIEYLMAEFDVEVVW